MEEEGTWDHGKLEVGQLRRKDDSCAGSEHQVGNLHMGGLHDQLGEESGPSGEEAWHLVHDEDQQ